MLDSACEPVSDFEPLHDPEALHAVAFVEIHVSATEPVERTLPALALKVSVGAAGGGVDPPPPDPPELGVEV